MKVYELYLKKRIANEVMIGLLSEIFKIDPGEAVIVEGFSADEEINSESLLCIVNRVSGEFESKIILCVYREELCKLTSLQLSRQLAELTQTSCLVFKGTDNPYLYAIVDSGKEYDVLVDDGLLEENDQITILKSCVN
ncbi:MAG: hypothetical protein P8163_08940 [Candidatus Thiodiazotropha sp.]